MDPIVVIPHSLEPQQVNTYQRPVFTVRVKNVTADEIRIDRHSRLVLKTFESMPGHGFTLLLEREAWIGPGREAVLRYEPPAEGLGGLNSVPHPARFEFDVKGPSLETTVVIQGIENTVRFAAHAGQHIDSVSFGPLFLPLVVVDRQGGFARCVAGHADNFPVDIELKWRDPAVGWSAFSDDGVDLVASGRVVLQQVRYQTSTGIALVPDPSVPANVVQVVGTVIASRCPLQRPSGGIGACIGAGSAVRAIVAESARIELSQPEPIATPLANRVSFEIRATLANPFDYPVDLRNLNSKAGRSAWPALRTGAPDGTFLIEDDPRIDSGIDSGIDAKGWIDRIGVRLLRGGIDMSQHVVLERFVGPDALGPGEALLTAWKCRLNGAPPGRYRLQPFTTGTVWFDGRHWENRFLQAEIDPGLADSGYGIEVQVA
jgi:hypothetical protein